jgi:hypothetical protein
MQLPRDLSAPKLAAAAVFAGAYAAVLAFDFPGHLSYDSVVQLLEGRSGVYADWHPPVMSWLLGLGDAVLPGTGLFVCFNAALLFASLVSLVWTRPKISWAVVPVAVACAALPQVLIYQGTIWKDVLFANASVAGFVCLAHAGERWAHRRARFTLTGLAFLLFALAALARQNGVIVLLAAAAALVWIARAGRSGAILRAPLVYGTGALLATLFVILVVRSALDLRVVNGSGPAAQLTLLELYDVVGAVKADPARPLDEIRRLDPPLEPLMRMKWAPLYSLREVDTIEDDFLDRLDSDPAFAAAIRAQWLDLVLHDPARYLAIRAAVFDWLFLTPGMEKGGPDAKVCLAYSLGVSGPDEEMEALGLKPRWTATDDALDDYAAGFLGTPAMSHPSYAILALAGLVVLVIRRRPADIALAAMLAAALAFTASFFIVSIACDYRYLYFLDLSALTALLYLAMELEIAAIVRLAARLRRAASP